MSRQNHVSTARRLGAVAAGAALALLPATAASAQSDSLSTGLRPLNGSGTSGSATVDISGSEVTVTVTTNGASPEQPHAQHIHIGGNNVCPTSAADTDGDGFISTPEGQPAYGAVQVSLTTEGDTSAESAVAVDRFPVADASGTVSYSRTFDLPSGVTADDVRNGVIVQHGIADTSLGEDPAAYDGPDSPLMAGVPQEATLPTACGSLAGAPAGGVAAGAGGATTATSPIGYAVATLALGGLAASVVSRRRSSEA
jgi:hypothetical protein